MAWNEASVSCISNDGVANGETFLPAAPRKSAITAMSGLKTFDEAAVPAGGSVGGEEEGEGLGAGCGSCADAFGATTHRPAVQRMTTMENSRPRLRCGRSMDGPPAKNPGAGRRSAPARNDGLRDQAGGERPET